MTKKAENKIALDGTTTTGYSVPVDLTHAPAGSIQWDVDDDASSFACTVTVWATNKGSPDLADDTDWEDITSTVTQPVVTGGDVSGFLVLTGDDAVYERVRIKYVRSAGSGTIRHWCSAKDTR